MENKDKKIIHREIERKRRHEMSTLHALLRSELPLEYIKGKRSSSDHMNEAVKYIKNLQKSIKDLGHKRDELKRSLSSDSLNHEVFNYVSISPCFGGVKIMFSEEKLQLSRVMEVLVEEGFDVVDCSSTNINENLLHTILCEVTDMKGFNLSELQQKLNNIVIAP